MIPLSITIKDWGPFVGSHTFKFSEAPGLYFLWGENRAEPRLGSNGAGKSRLWQALTWVFHGKDLDGKKAGDVANWKVGKGASVEFCYSMGGEQWVIVRRWSPNAWELLSEHGEVFDLAKDNTNLALVHVKLSFTAWKQTVMLGQDQDLFLDLGAEQKAALFAELMNLDHWLDLAAKASKKSTEEDGRARTLEAHMGRLEGQLQQLDNDTGAEASRIWEEDRQKRLGVYTHEFEAGATRQAKMKDGLKAVEAQANEMRERARKAREQEDSIRLMYTELDKTEPDARAEVTLLQSQLDALIKHEAMLDEMDDCPTCGQTIDTKHKRKEQEAVSKQVFALDRDLAAAKRHHSDVKAKAREWEDAFNKAVEETEKLTQRVRELEQDIKDRTRSITLMDRDLDDIEMRVERLEAQTNPHAAADTKRAEERERLTEAVRATRRHLDQASNRAAYFSYWARWCKDIRLMLISEALAQLEIEVNNELHAAGLDEGWALQFAVDRETNAGTVKRGFNVLVLSPHNDRAVPWEMWSGGEAQRLRVATQCGLANLARAQTGASINLEVWDEPTNGLSEQGINDLLTMLARRAEDEQRAIWVIDHRSHSFGGFAGSSGVIKTDASSSFDQTGLYNGGGNVEVHEQPVSEASNRAAHDVRRIGRKELT